MAALGALPNRFSFGGLTPSAPRLCAAPDTGQTVLTDNGLYRRGDYRVSHSYLGCRVDLEKQTRVWFFAVLCQSQQTFSTFRFWLSPFRGLSCGKFAVTALNFPDPTPEIPCYRS